jgi:hypothetical protein
MRIIANELKKIWSVKIFVIIAALCVLYFILSMRTWIVTYPRGTWFGSVDFAHHLTERYGTTLEHDDFEDYLNYREVIVSELNPFIASSPVFAEAGIFNYDDYENFLKEFGPRYDTHNDDERSLWYAVHLEWGYIVRTSDGDIKSDNETPLAYNKMTSFGNVVGSYERNILRNVEWNTNIDYFIEDTPLNERELRRINEIKDSSELLSVMDWSTTFHTWRYAQSLAVLVILITLILVSPLIATDRANRVNWLQYSSKQGRNILKKQFIAVLVSAAGITTILVIIFAGIYGVTTGVYAFWNNGISSFMSGSFHWLSITYGQYCLLIIGVIYLLSIGTAAFSFILSRFSQNMIRLIFKVIPFFIAAMLLSNLVLNEFLGVYTGGNVLLQIYSLMFAFIVGVGISVSVVHKEKKVELR